MTTKTESDLIGAVKEKPILYNRTLLEHRDAHARIRAWHEISAHINLGVEECKHMWSSLRNRFTNALKRRISKPHRHFGKWLHEDRMLFLLPYLDQQCTAQKYISVCGEISQPEGEEDDETASEIPLGDASDGSDSEWNINEDHHDDYDNNVILKDFKIIEQSEPERTQTKNSTPVVTFNEQLKRSLSKYDGDDLFYLSMARAIKTLPKVEQAKLRIKVAQLISEAEIQAEEENC